MPTIRDSNLQNIKRALAQSDRRYGSAALQSRSEIRAHLDRGITTRIYLEITRSRIRRVRHVDQRIKSQNLLFFERHRSQQRRLSDNPAKRTYAAHDSPRPCLHFPIRFNR